MGVSWGLLTAWYESCVLRTPECNPPGLPMRLLDFSQLHRTLQEEKKRRRSVRPTTTEIQQDIKTLLEQDGLGSHLQQLQA